MYTHRHRCSSLAHLGRLRLVEEISPLLTNVSVPLQGVLPGLSIIFNWRTVPKVVFVLYKDVLRVLSKCREFPNLQRRRGCKDNITREIVGGHMKVGHMKVGVLYRGKLEMITDLVTCPALHVRYFNIIRFLPPGRVCQCPLSE
jgi:hypothetical protein